MKKILKLVIACSMGSMLWQTNLLSMESVDANRQAQAARVGAATTAEDAQKAMHGADADIREKFFNPFAAEPEQPKPAVADKSASEVKPAESKYAAGKKRVEVLKAELKQERAKLKKAEAGLGPDLIHKKSMNDSLGLKMKYEPDEQKKITAWEKAKANVRAKKKELKKEQIKLKKEKVKKTVKGVIKKVMPKKKTNAPKKPVVHGKY